MDDLAHAAGHQPDTVFVRFHFLGNADQHGRSAAPEVSRARKLA
jgi:hypothetical protein